MLLAIDTTTDMAGVALYDEQGLRGEQVWRSSANHTVELMPYIVRACDQQSLKPTDLKAVGVSLGPGSFTGVRVGMSVAKGLALALAIPLLGVPALDAAAYAHCREVLPVCAVLRAGRRRWCSAFYQTVAGHWQRQTAYALANTEQLIASLQEPAFICGELDLQLRQELQQARADIVLASPAAAVRRPGYLAELAWKRFVAGERDDLTSLAPIYLQSVGLASTS